MSSVNVFVCGATGTQGGALIDHLFKSNANIHAVTRTPDSEAAQRLKALGVSITKGDFDDDESFRKPMANCTSLFLNLMPKLTDLNASLEQARRILKIAKDAGIKQVIYASATSADDPRRLKDWDPSSIISTMMLNKQAIENEIRTAGFEYWTILRPAHFMTNFLSPMARMYQGFTETGVFTTAYTPDTVLPMVDPHDIGAFAAAAVLNPAGFNQQGIPIASQFLGVEDLIQYISRATGRELKIVYLSEEEVQSQKATNPFIAGQHMARSMASLVDLEEVKKWNLPLGTFDQFLQREKARVDATYL
ncbi:hypothetical protein N7541_006311 [Penicillium brevicompactum]|uniref:NmrA-like domain-containing protein n=1 Tax=Penicillium brevicompactum TaxID=5074 RepID=A0A9W9R4T4_PENBR|nr:hypothetical protein N7541_006311 [Penicillium brevicompactum]